MTMATNSASNDTVSLLPAPVTVSDEEWSEISELADFPDEARIRLDWAISHYRAMTTALDPDWTSSATTSLLSDLSHQLKQLQEDMQTLLHNPRALVALTLAQYSGDAFTKAMNDRMATRQLTSAQSEMVLLTDWFAKAKIQIAKSPSGARGKAICIQLFVHALDQIHQHFRGVGISRSTKGPRTSRDYIAMVCRIADPDIGPGSIDEAMKRLIKSRGGMAS